MRTQKAMSHAINHGEPGFKMAATGEALFSAIKISRMEHSIPIWRLYYDKYVPEIHTKSIISMFTDRAWRRTRKSMCNVIMESKMVGQILKWQPYDKSVHETMKYGCLLVRLFD